MNATEPSALSAGVAMTAARRPAPASDVAMTTSVTFVTSAESYAAQFFRNSSFYQPIETIEHAYPTPLVAGLSCALVLLMAAALFGNTLVILSVARFPAMRTRTNIFLVNLAVTDVMVALLNMPVALVTVIRGRWEFGVAGCEFNGFLSGLGAVLSIHTMMCISIHKYISMTRPFSRFMTRRKICVIITAAWIWSILYNLTPQLELTHNVYKTGATQCGPEIPHNTKQLIHSGVNTIVNFLIPLAVMLFCYFTIFLRIRQHLDRMRETSNMAERRRMLQQQRVAVTLFLVLACFLLCMLPYIVYSVGLVVATERIPLWLNPVAYWFIYANSALNPITYGARSSTFRESYKNILLRRNPSRFSNAGSLRSCPGSSRDKTRTASRKLSGSTCRQQRCTEAAPIAGAEKTALGDTSI